MGPTSWASAWRWPLCTSRRAPCHHNEPGAPTVWEVLAALANGLLLFAMAGYVLFEAWRRFAEPPEVAGVALMVIAAVGLAVNVVSFRLLRAGSAESLNVKGAYLEVVADMVGSVGVIAAGAVVATTGWPYADPIIGAASGCSSFPVPGDSVPRRCASSWRLPRPTSM